MIDILVYQTSLWNEKSRYTIESNTEVIGPGLYKGLSCLLSHKFQHLEGKIVALQSAFARVGLKINAVMT